MLDSNLCNSLPVAGVAGFVGVLTAGDVDPRLTGALVVMAGACALATALRYTP